MSERVALEARDVDKTYPGDVEALRGVSLRVLVGETVALIGGSGCGKTTLLKMFNRTETPTRGEVFVGERDVAAVERHELRRHLGYVPQDGGLLPHWTVERNVSLVPWLLSWEKERRLARTRELLGWVGLDLEEHGGRYPGELSGGQKQRVAIARALAADPPAVLLDEPFGALDAITRRGLQVEFARLRGELGKTMLLVTHDLEEAFRLADRIGVLDAGRLVAIGTREEIERSSEEYVQRLLEAFGERS